MDKDKKRRNPLRLTRASLKAGQQNPLLPGLIWALIAVSCMTSVLIATVGLWMINPGSPRVPKTSEAPAQPSPEPPQPEQTPKAADAPPVPAAETTDKSVELREHLNQLGISYLFFQALLSEFVATAGFSQVEMDLVAKNLVTRLEALTPETRSKLGTYNLNNYKQWSSEVSDRKTLDRLTDQQFYKIFPELKDARLNSQTTFGQIWYALAEEQLTTVKAMQPMPRSDRSLNRRSRYPRGRRVPMSTLRIARVDCESKSAIA